MSAKPLPSVLAAFGAANPTAQPDADLLARFVAGDQPAFAELVRRYARLVWRVARTRCHTESAAEDVFQATFVVLSRKAGSIRTGAALAGWLHRTAHRLAVRAAKKERPAVPLHADTPVSADPLDALTARELLSAVDDELAKLADGERAVLALCGIDGLTNDEAARRLGTSPGSVKGRLERARAKLRLRLDARGLTLPAVALGLISSSPRASAMQAALAVPRGGAIPASVEQLLAEGLSMKGTIAKAAVALLLAGALVGGFSDRGPAPRVNAAPVPKAADKRVVWSEPVRVDWKASGAEQVTGVWTPDGKSVVVPAPLLSADGKPLPGGGIDFRDPASGKVTNSLRYAHGSDTAAFQPASLVISPDGKTVAAAGSVYAAGKKAEAKRVVLLWPGLADKGRTELPTPADALAFSPDGKHLTALSRTIQGDDTIGLVRAWDVNSLKLAFATRARHLPAAFAYCHPNENALFVGGAEGKVLGVRASDGGTLWLLGGAGMKIRAVAMSADGKVTALGGEADADGGVSLRLLAGDAPETTDPLPKGERINGLGFSPDGKHLAAACSDGGVRVFDMATGKLSAAAKAHAAEVFTAAYSPDGKRLLTVGRDAVKVWDVEELMKGK